MGSWQGPWDLVLNVVLLTQSPFHFPLSPSLYLNNLNYSPRASWVVLTNKTLTTPAFTAFSWISSTIALLSGGPHKGRTVYQNHCVEDGVSNTPLPREYHWDVWMYEWKEGSQRLLLGWQKKQGQTLHISSTLIICHAIFFFRFSLMLILP